MDYKNGKIYSIRSPHTDKVYIGSTTQPLFKRFSKHKWNYNSWKKGNSYEKKITSFDIFDYGDAYIELIEEYPCENKMLLNKREGEIIRSMECVNQVKNVGVNKRETKESLYEYEKEWRLNNPDKIAEYNKRKRELRKTNHKS